MSKPASRIRNGINNSLRHIRQIQYYIEVCVRQPCVLRSQDGTGADVTKLLFRFILKRNRYYPTTNVWKFPSQLYCLNYKQYIHINKITSNVLIYSISKTYRNCINIKSLTLKGLSPYGYSGHVHTHLIRQNIQRWLDSNELYNYIILIFETIQST